jgi:WD40 repeat protein
MKFTPLSSFTPASKSRSWLSTPHPSLPLLATASSDKSVRVYSLQSFNLHSTLDDGHKRSIRSVAWKPNLRAGTLGLVTGSFDATAGVWRRSEDQQGDHDATEFEVRADGGSDDGDKHDWEFSLILEGHDSEIKSVSFSPSGQFLATCARDKSVWIWEEIGSEGEDEWETVAVLQDHEGDVKFVAWAEIDGVERCASASYDDTIRLWKDDGDDWGCISVLKGHDGTVWALDWEDVERGRKKGNDVEENHEILPCPRLLSCSADETIKVWRRIPPAEPAPVYHSNGIPSTMRPSHSGEEWEVEATLPKVHDRPIYSISWSKKTGRAVSTGSDSRVVVYEEREAEGKKEWVVLATLEGGHGPYEINHVTWCGRFDGGRKGEEEMIVTTGDDGIVRAWALEE